MDRWERYKQNNRWIDRREMYKIKNRWIDGKDINRQIDGQTGQILIDKQMDRRDRY